MAAGTGWGVRQLSLAARGEFTFLKFSQKEFRLASAWICCSSSQLMGFH